MKKDLVNKKLIDYVENEIFKVYELNGEAHGINHVKTVLERAFEIAKLYNDIDYNILYTAVSYHDIGDHIDRATHEIISAKWMMNDEVLNEFFDTDEKIIIKEAIEDHRSSGKNEPRSIYGKILASADKNTDVYEFLERTLKFGKEHYKELNMQMQIERAYEHAVNKFGKQGYAIHKYYVKDEKYENYLKELQKLIDNKAEFYKLAEKIYKEAVLDE